MGAEVAERSRFLRLLHLHSAVVLYLPLSGARSIYLQVVTTFSLFVHGWGSQDEPGEY
jgi:hypothetical protein